MKQRLINLRGTLVSLLRQNGYTKMLAFFRSLPEFLYMAGAGFATYTLKTDSTVLHVLKIAVFVLAVVWWAIRLYESYQQEKNVAF